MSNSLENVVNTFDQLCVLPLFIWWDWWIPDEAWAAYLSNKEGGFSCPITHGEFNYALKQTQPYQTILYFLKHKMIVAFTMTKEK